MKFSASPVFLFLVRLLVVAALGRSRSLLVEVNVRFALEFLAEACRCWLRLGISCRKVWATTSPGLLKGLLLYPWMTHVSVTVVNNASVMMGTIVTRQ